MSERSVLASANLISWVPNIFAECSARDGDDQVDLKHVWDVVRRKLLDSLDSIEQGHDIRKAVLEYEQQHPKQPLSLSAIAEGPKLRLLWAAFEQLEQEAGPVSDICSHSFVFLN